MVLYRTDMRPIWNVQATFRFARGKCEVTLTDKNNSLREGQFSHTTERQRKGALVCFPHRRSIISCMQQLLPPQIYHYMFTLTAGIDDKTCGTNVNSQKINIWHLYQHNMHLLLEINCSKARSPSLKYNQSELKISLLKQTLWCFSFKKMVLRLRDRSAKGALLKLSLTCI